MKTTKPKSISLLSYEKYHTTEFDMVKCPHCKENFDEKDLVIVRIQKEVLISYGQDEYRLGNKEGFDICSCPKCRTFLNCHLLY